MLLSHKKCLPESVRQETGVIKFKVGRHSFPNFVYIAFDPHSREAVVIDPGWEAELIAITADEHRLTVKAILLTHSHRDHTNEAIELVKRLCCPIYASRETLTTLTSDICSKFELETHTPDHLGRLQVTALMTPGHTSCSVCYRIGDCLFPGDTLFNEGCGLIAEPNGDAHMLFSSVSQLIECVPDETRVFPGHQYRKPVGQTFAAIKSQNFHLGLTKEESFIAFCNRPRKGQKPPTVGSVPNMIAEVSHIPFNENDLAPLSLTSEHDKSVNQHA